MNLYAWIFVMPAVPPAFFVCAAVADCVLQRRRWHWYDWLSVVLLLAALTAPTVWLSRSARSELHRSCAFGLIGHSVLAPLVAAYGAVVGAFALWVVMWLNRRP